jgi:glyoxylase-like metal-dependent hydrolase (beta-lactamase superfamily II)
MMMITVSFSESLLVRFMLRHTIGDISIDRIVESENADIDPTFFFPETSAEDWAPHKSWLKPLAMHPETEMLILPIQSWLVRTRHHTILVDTCVGDDKKRERPHWHMKTGATFLARLADAGVNPEEVDFVMCTHLHADHVGWNTRLVDGRWVPTFPNAKYVMSKNEWAFWEAEHEQNPMEHFADSVLPIVAANRAVMVENDHALDDEVWFEPTPGHTPHHMSVRLASNGYNAVMTGDVMHSPAQCAEPTWAVRPDYDREMARQTRRAFLERYCESGTLVCATHFASPSMGEIIHHDDAFRFKYLTEDS